MNADYNFLCATYNEVTKKDPREMRVGHVCLWFVLENVYILLWLIHHHKNVVAYQA